MKNGASSTIEPISRARRVRIMLRLAGELVTKSRRVRARFQRRLVDNLHDALGTAAIEHTIHYDWSRIFIEADSDEATQVISQVFGISSFSVIEHTCEPTLAAIVATGEDGFKECVRGRTFAVRARRGGDEPFRSLDIQVQLGAALNRYGSVDLSNPDVTVYVEVRPDEAYLLADRAPGAGGLPLGVQGRAVALVSGGFDSAVAAWMMLKRGVELDYVFCNLAGAAYERAVLGVMKILTDTWSYGSRPVLHVIDFEPMVAALRSDVRRPYVQVVLKRLMYRAATKIAWQLKAQAIVTGESVGQVSSQTLTNLRAIDEVTTLPVLRPLVGIDKEEIIELSRRVGTCALSSRVQEYCALVPQRPATAAKPRAVREEESRLDLTVLDRLVDERRRIDMRELGPDDLVLPYLYASDIPEGATVIDVRGEGHFAGWHYPGAQNRDLDELVRNFRRLDRGATYVLYCALGLQSAVVAERMQREGYQAYTFKGGLPALKRYAREQGGSD